MLDGIDVCVRVSYLNLSWRVLLLKLLCTPPTKLSKKSKWLYLVGLKFNLMIYSPLFGAKRL